MAHKGICYLVGAGPGDLGLVTLRAKELVGQADVIIYDYLCNPRILEWIRAGAEVVYAGKQAGAHTMAQDEINDLIVARAAGGKRVVRLKGGDPFVFGRGGEEAQALVRAGVDFEVVPGVSSALAGPAYAGIPVTHRDHCSQLTIFTGHEDPEKSATSLDFHQLANAPGTKVLLMGVERIRPIASAFVSAGADPATPVALVRWATTGRQETVTGTLADIADVVEQSGFKPPAVAVIGGVVRLRDELGWFEKRPLLGRRIVVTRTRKQAGVLSEQLLALGADVLEIPTIRIDPPADPERFTQMVRDAHNYDWLVFTSPNGVESFFEEFFGIFGDAREIGGVRIAAIGPATAAKVRSYRLSVDLQPADFVAEAVVGEFLKIGTIENLQILLVRAEQARDVLPGRLAKLGAIVDIAVAYRTVPETADPFGARERFAAEGADVITFTSSSTVENFLALGLPMPRGVLLASIGPVTSATLRDHGQEVAIEADQHDIPGLIGAIVAYFQRHQPAVDGD